MATSDRRPAHGTEQRYKHRLYPCSCERCRAAHAAAQRVRRRRHRARATELTLFDPCECAG